MLPERIDEDLALVLWRAVRDVREYAEIGAESEGDDGAGPPSHVAERIRNAAAAAPEIAPALSRLGELKWREGTCPEKVATACREVSIWAERNHLLSTATDFAEAAARCCPLAPAPARQAGRLNRRLGMDDRAREWYERALALARRMRDVPELRGEARDEYIKTRLWYGFLCFQHGDHALAMRHYRAAGTVARKSGPLRLAGVAHHNMLTVASDREAYALGESHARSALRCYPVHFPRIPHLLHDFAYLLLRSNYYDPALTLLEASYPLIPAPHERIVVCGNLARAAGGLRDEKRYATAMIQIEQIASRTDENVSRGMLGLAEGALHLGETERARHFAALTIRYAERRRDKEPLLMAERLLSNLESPESGRIDPAVAPASAYQLAGAMLERLRRWTAPPRGQAVHMLRRLRSADAADQSPRTAGSV